MDLLTAAKRYRNARIEVTKCQQNHFRLTCVKCSEYIRCKRYEGWGNAWLDLQDAIMLEESK